MYVCKLNWNIHRYVFHCQSAQIAHDAIFIVWVSMKTIIDHFDFHTP